MVNCSKCGYDNSSKNNFCEKCGNSLKNFDYINEQSNTNNSSNIKSNQQKSKSNIKVICLGIIVAAVLLTIIGSFFVSSQPIDLEKIETPSGFFNGSHNKTYKNFVNYNGDSIAIVSHDNKDEVARLPLALEDRGNRIIKENQYEKENFEINEMVYSDYNNHYSNLYFIQFDNKWYTVWYYTNHINYGVANANNPVHQVIDSMIYQYQHN